MLGSVPCEEEGRGERWWKCLMHNLNLLNVRVSEHLKRYAGPCWQNEAQICFQVYTRKQWMRSSHRSQCWQSIVYVQDISWNHTVFHV